LPSQVALGGGAEAEDTTGALQAVASEPFGWWLLLALAAGFGGNALWAFSPGLLRPGPRGWWAEAVGLDETLRTLADEPYGPYVIGAVGVGLAAFGLFSFVEARYRDL
jgi:hypothetical protein